MCLRARTCQLPNRAYCWYVVHLSNDIETSSSVLRPCDKDKLRKMKKEAKRRRIEWRKKMQRQIFGQRVDEEDNSTPMLTDQ